MLYGIYVLKWPRPLQKMCYFTILLHAEITVFRCLIYCYLAFAVQLINLSGKGVLIIFLVTWQTTETHAHMGNTSCRFTALLLMVPQGKKIYTSAENVYKGNLSS